MNGGWLHPECTNDLKDLSQEAIDAIDTWYCEDCKEKTNKTATKKRTTSREPKARTNSSTKIEKKRALR